MEVIGTVGAIGGIIDVATRSISTLADVRKRYNQANMTAELLSVQLVATKTALDQIHHLIEESLKDDTHYQLVMNMGDAINGCNLLIRVLDEQISKLVYDEDKNMTFESRVKLILESKGTEECLTRIDRLVSALNLIITAYHARSPNLQKAMMEDKKSQKIFDQVKDDSSSLCVLYDSASFVTRRTKTTVASSKLSMNFAFDNELFQHPAYKSTFRSLLRRAAAPQSHGTSDTSPRPPKPPKPTQEEQSQRNAAIEHMLEVDSRRLQQEVKILALGNAPQLIQQWKIIHHNGYTQEQRMLYRWLIYDRLSSQLQRAMMFNMETIPNLDFDHHSKLLGSMPKGAALIDGFDENAITTLRWCADYLARHHVLDDPESYFIGEIDRILEPEYIPSETDILNAPPTTTCIYETRFNWESLSFHIFQTSSLSVGDRKKWIHLFENINAIIFTVNLACFNQTLLEESNGNRMMEVLVQFDGIVNSRWFTHTSIMLMLCNINLFKEKLARWPLQDYFPDYSGGPDVDRAAKYLLWRFNQVNRAQLNLYPHLVELSDRANVRLAFAAMRETVLENALKDSDIL